MLADWRTVRYVTCEQRITPSLYRINGTKREPCIKVTVADQDYTDQDFTRIPVTAAVWKKIVLHEEMRFYCVNGVCNHTALHQLASDYCVSYEYQVSYQYSCMHDRGYVESNNVIFLQQQEAQQNDF